MTDITIDGTHILMPELIHGAGSTPDEGACIMQAAAWLGSDGAWTDSPPCVHPIFRRLAIWINDSVDKETRQQLWPLIPRLIGTGRSGDRQADNRLNVQLAVWSAERVLPLIKDQARNRIATERVKRVRAWLEQPPAAYAAAAYAAAGAAEIRFLIDLLDEYDQITGRTTPAVIPIERWKELRKLLTNEN